MTGREKDGDERHEIIHYDSVNIPARSFSHVRRLQSRQTISRPLFI